MKKSIILAALVPFVLTSCNDVSSENASVTSTQSSLKIQNQGLESERVGEEKLQAGITKKTQKQKQKKKKYDARTQAS